MEDCRGISTLPPMENPMPEHVDVLWRRPPSWSTFSGRKYSPRVAHTGSVCSCWTIPHGREPILEQFLKRCNLWEGLLLEEFLKGCIAWESSHTGAEEERVEETEAEMKHHEQPLLLILLLILGKQNRAIENEAVRLSLGRRTPHSVFNWQ